MPCTAHIPLCQVGRFSTPVTSLVLYCAARILLAIQKAMFDHNGEPGVFPSNFGIGVERSLSIRILVADFESSGNFSPRWSVAPSLIEEVIVRPPANVEIVQQVDRDQHLRREAQPAATWNEASPLRRHYGEEEYGHGHAGFLGLQGGTS